MQVRETQIAQRQNSPSDYTLELGCSKGVFEELANFIICQGSVEILYFVVWFSLVIYGEIKGASGSG